MRLFTAPPEARLLNYDCNFAITALVNNGDRTNRRIFEDEVPGGLSQTSHISNFEDSGFLSNFDGDDDDASSGENGSFDAFKHAIYDMFDAVDVSDCCPMLEEKIRRFISEVTAEARGSIAGTQPCHGSKRVSMLRAYKRNRVTHGTAHMNPF